MHVCTKNCRQITTISKPSKIFFVTKITINVACFIIYLIEVVTSAVRKGARMDEIHERDSVDYLMQQTVAVFTGVTVKIGFLSRRKRRRYVG